MMVDVSETGGWFLDNALSGFQFFYYNYFF